LAVLGFFCVGWGYIVAFTKVIAIYQYTILEFTLSTILLYPSCTHCEMLSTGSFLHLYSRLSVCQAGNPPLEPHPQPFLLKIFLNRILCICLTVLDYNTPTLCLQCSWNDRHATPCPAFCWFRWTFVNFLLKLASNHHLPDLCLPKYQ
jgi:hypothetical protein